MRRLPRASVILSDLKHNCPAIWRTLLAYDTGTNRFGFDRSIESRCECSAIHGCR